MWINFPSLVGKLWALNSPTLDLSFDGTLCFLLAVKMYLGKKKTNKQTGEARKKPINCTDKCSALEINNVWHRYKICRLVKAALGGMVWSVARCVCEPMWRWRKCINFCSGRGGKFNYLFWSLVHGGLSVECSFREIEKKKNPQDLIYIQGFLITLSKAKKCLKLTSAQ